MARMAIRIIGLTSAIWGATLALDAWTIQLDQPDGETWMITLCIALALMIVAVLSTPVWLSGLDDDNP